MSGGLSRLSRSGEVLVLTASDEHIQNQMALRARAYHLSPQELLVYELQQAGSFYKNRDEARISLEQAPAKTFALWLRQTEEPKTYGVLLRAGFGLPLHLYASLPEELVDFVACDKVLRELADCDAVATSYEDAQKILKADHVQTLVAWLSKQSNYTSFRILTKHQADVHTSPLISFHDFPRIVGEHQAMKKEPAAPQAISEPAVSKPAISMPAVSLYDLAFGREVTIIQELQAKGRFFANRAEAQADLKIDHTKTFAVWKSESDSTKYGLYMYMVRNDSALPLRVSLKKLPQYVECAEVVCALAQKGLCVQDYTAALSLMQNERDKTIIAWSEQGETERTLCLLTRLPTGEITITKNIPITKFAQSVRDHYAQESWNKQMASKS